MTIATFAFRCGASRRLPSERYSQPEAFWQLFFWTRDMNTGAQERDPKEAWPPFRVLCVDDNRDCADSAALLLRTMGFDSRACYDGKTALGLNDSFRPGICFLDLNMPGMDGDEVAVRLLSQSSWRPLLIVAMTAMSDQAASVRIAAAGFHMHLVKPVEPVKLLEVIDALFNAAEQASKAWGMCN
jgi:two-component system OmpR family response regulator